MSMTEGNLTNLLIIRNGNLPYVVLNASSGFSVLISFARVSIVAVNLPFLQSHRQRKMAARFFLHGDHLAKVVLSGTPLLRPVQYDRTFLRPVQYDRTFIDFVQYHCLDRTPDCTFLGTGLLLPRWRTGKPAGGMYLFYNHFISILIVIQYQRPDLRT